MNKYKTISQLVIVAGVVCVLLYDAWAFYMGGQEATISSIIVNEWIYKYPAFVFLSGFLCGHLFFPMSKYKAKGQGE